MQNLERLMVEKGQVIQKRYQLQRLAQQGQACAIYQGFDEVLKRTVAIKVVPAEHVPAYQAAIRATSQFSHPNIIGIYDVLIEPQTLYIVQEYVEGDNFGSLLQAQLSPYQVVDLGVQICQALLYAGSSSRKTCHGDLTPDAILRDRFGGVRVNNFALPTDINYFSAWSVVGGNGIAVSDQHLPVGQMSDGRRDDDTRAVGLLLYQLLTGRNAGATSIDPPADGRLRFLRNVPPELCDIVARAVVRQHPQHLSTPDALHTELKALAQALEPPPPSIAIATKPAMPLQTEGLARPDLAIPRGPVPVGTGQLVLSPSPRDAIPQGSGIYALRSDLSSPMETIPGAAPTVADMSAKLAAARQAAYANEAPSEPRRVNMPVLLLLGLVLFALFFVIGFFLAHAIIP